MTTVVRWRWLAIVLVTAVATGAMLSNSFLSEDREGNRDTLRREREKYFRQMREYPLGRVPQDAYLEAWRQRARMGSHGERLLAAGAIAANWISIGPQPIRSGTSRYSGWTNDIAFDPRDPRILYISASMGGAWKSVDRGASWRPLMNTACASASHAVAVDPGEPEALYVGTGFFPYAYGCGLLRSGDGGDSWTVLGASTLGRAPWGDGGLSIMQLQFYRPSGWTGPPAILAATNGGLWRSPDGGETWTAVITNDWYMPVLDVQPDPDSSKAGTFWAAVVDPYSPYSKTGIWRSTDGGVTWTQLGSTPSLAGSQDIQIAFAAAPSQSMYLAALDPTGQTVRVYRSQDGGDTWVQGATLGSFYGTTGVLAVDPVDPASVFLGQIVLLRSTDGGMTFESVGWELHADIRAIAFDPVDPTSMYVACDGGIYQSTNRINFHDLNTTLSTVQFYPGMTVDPDNPAHVLGGTQDNGTNERFSELAWDLIFGGDGGSTALTYRAPKTLYLQYQLTPPLRRKPGESYFSAVHNGINLSDRVAFIPAFVMDPVDDRILYYGTFRMYQTINGGDLWTAISGDLTDGGGVISAIAVSAADPNVIWVGTSGGQVHRSTDGGLTWRDRTGSLPPRWVSDLAPDPRNPEAAWVTLGGFNSGHVFTTNDGGQLWRNASANLPNIPATAVALVPIGANYTTVVGTDVGLFIADTNASSWTPAGPDLPIARISDIVYNQSSNELFISTFGRGMYSLRLGEGPLRGDANGDQRITAVDAMLTLRGSTSTPGSDANCDGVTTSEDAYTILSYLTGPTNGLCIGLRR